MVEETVVIDQAAANANYDPFNLDRFGDEELFGSTETEEEAITAEVEPEEVTEVEDSDGMSTAGKVFLWLFILLFVIPGLLLLAAFLIGKYKPDSKVGAKVNIRYALFK